MTRRGLTWQSSRLAGARRAVPDWPQPLIEGDFQLFDASTQDGFAEELSGFLAAGERPLVFTAGTGNLHAADFFSCALGAVNGLGRRAIFLTRERAQVPALLPESVLWQPYVPLSALLPHAAALVHHGGIGTTAEALRSSTPPTDRSLRLGSIRQRSSHRVARRRHGHSRQAFAAAQLGERSSGPLRL